jgi:preprotein translocase subunit SecA
MPEGEPIEHPLVSRSLESAQRKVEARNFDIRKQLLEYDDVANDQRKVIYAQRNELLETDDISDTVTAMREGVLHDVFRLHVPAESVEEQWDLPGSRRRWPATCRSACRSSSGRRTNPISATRTCCADRRRGGGRLHRKGRLVGAEMFHQFERNVMLQSLDTHWREHLAALDHLRQGIHLRGYAQKNPKQEYKREAFELFQRLLDSVRSDVTRTADDRAGARAGCRGKRPARRSAECPLPPCGL